MALRKTHAAGRLGGALLVLMLLLAACGGSDGGSKSNDATGGTGGTDDPAEASLPSETGPIGSPDDGGSPVEGGVLRAIVANSDPGGLDPVKNLGAGSTGLNELTAIFDQLVRYDPIANEYVPQMAESLTANADNTEYTVKLRPGVKFTDGTPVDSAAVKANFDRFSGPASIQVYAAILPQITSMETPDDLTVVIKLDGPDASFPYLLTQPMGLVVSPTAVKTMGDEAFNLAPVGAGPFKVKSYKPGVGLTLERNPDYWGEAPHLDGIEFTWVADDRARVEALKNGDVDVVITGSPVQSVEAFENGATGFGWLTYGSPVVSMNMREGFPFADVRLRRAVALALDPETVSKRAFQGLSYASKELFPEGLLRSGAEGLPTDPEEAKALVEEVKADTGWDGSFVLLSSPEPSVHDTALSVQAMLNNVGFNATVETPTDWTTHVYVQFDHDAVVTSLGFLETDPYVFLVYEAGGDYSPSGFKDERMDAAILDLRGASSEAATKAATKEMQEIWNDVVPSVWLGHRVDRMFQSKKVHGLVPTASAVALFHEAWLTR
jgi:peptide/nickel transport system substrate-binding protein